MAKVTKKTEQMWMPKDFSGSVEYCFKRKEMVEKYEKKGEYEEKEILYFLGKGIVKKGKEPFTGDWKTARSSVFNEMVDKVSDDDDDWCNKVLKFVEGQIVAVTPK